MEHSEYIDYYVQLAHRLESENRNLKAQVKGHKAKLQRFKNRLARGSDYESSCVRKKYFETRAHAQCWIQAEGREQLMDIYKCRHCDGHHLTTRKS